MKKTLGAVIAAATLTLASQAPAAVVNFNASTTSGSLGFGGLTWTATGSYGSFTGPSTYGSGTAAVVSAFASGLGVVGAGIASSVVTPETTSAGLGRRIDGAEAGSWEMLTITFSGAVNLTNFVLGLMDDDDDFEYSIDGGSFASVGAVASAIPATNETRTYIQNLTSVTSFSVRATGSVGDTADDFILAGVDVSAVETQDVTPVPLPAGAPLLLAGLAGLAALRRRKTAA